MVVPFILPSFEDYDPSRKEMGGKCCGRMTHTEDLLDHNPSKSENWSRMANWPNEETDNPHYADDRNFYKLEKWTRDGTKIDSLVYAGNNLDRARDLFAKAIKHRPKIRLTMRQRTRVLEQYP